MQKLHDREMRHHVAVSRPATSGFGEMFVEAITRSKNGRRYFMKAEVTVVNLPDPGSVPSLGR